MPQKKAVTANATEAEAGAKSSTPKKAPKIKKKPMVKDKPNKKLLGRSGSKGG